MKIVNVVGARPNLIKIAPLMAAYAGHPSIEALLVHTGQHYDETMSELFFEQLGIPKPDINLEVGSASHAVQTAEIMKAFEGVLVDHRPDVVLVVGDVNSTIACGLVAVKLGIRLVHVEAGLRSRDRTMPEEINRILTDAISDLLFCTEQSGVDNLIAEGVPRDRIHLGTSSSRTARPCSMSWASSGGATRSSPCTGRPTSTIPRHSTASSMRSRSSRASCRSSSPSTRERAGSLPTRRSDDVPRRCPGCGYWIPSDSSISSN
jgi:UDP-N-acetylglucosamine 2-epimerase (non-hydrolysing)